METTEFATHAWSPGVEPRLGPARRGPRVEIVVPVRDERAALADSIETLHEFLVREFPFEWSIVIADRDSKDGTAEIAATLSRRLEGVSTVSVGATGRGRALREVWGSSDAEILCYLTLKYTADPRGLTALVAPIAAGHGEIAAGSRLVRQAGGRRRAAQSPASRFLALAQRIVLRTRFRDARCAFKAGRADTLNRLMPDVRDDGEFFDTELLVLAQRNGIAISEVPVTVPDDSDSRGDASSTTIHDLRGVARLAYGDRIYRFIAIGALSTLAYALIYLAMRGACSAGVSNAIALGITAIGNTSLNRGFTFGLGGRHSLVRDYAMGAAVFFATLFITTAALRSLQAADPHPGRWVEMSVLIASSILATIVRYVALRFWVFARVHSEPRKVENPLSAALIEPASANAGS